MSGKARAFRLTEEQYAQINALKGVKSSARIAIEFNCSQSRVKMIWSEFRRSGAAEGKSRQERDIEKKRARGGLSFSPIVGYWTNTPGNGEEVPPDPVVTHGKDLLSLEKNECRWPIGVDEDGHYRFCACRCNGGSYCETHDGRKNSHARVTSLDQLLAMIELVEGQLAPPLDETEPDLVTIFQRAA